MTLRPPPVVAIIWQYFDQTVLNWCGIERSAVTLHKNSTLQSKAVTIKRVFLAVNSGRHVSKLWQILCGRSSRISDVVSLRHVYLRHSSTTRSAHRTDAVRHVHTVKDERGCPGWRSRSTDWRHVWCVRRGIRRWRHWQRVRPQDLCQRKAADCCLYLSVTNHSCDCSWFCCQRRQEILT